MAKRHGGVRGLVVTGFSAATLTLALLLPATALADPITVKLDDNQLALQANQSKASNHQWQDQNSWTDQSSKAKQSQDSDLSAYTNASAKQYSDQYTSSTAYVATYSGEANAYGPTTSVDLDNWQNSNASANGNATAYNVTGAAGGGISGPAYANGGTIDQSNYPTTGDANADSWSASATYDPANANAYAAGIGGNGGISAALCAVGNGNFSDWECKKGSFAKSSANGGDGSGSANGGWATSNGSSTSSANSTGGTSGSNGDSSNTATGANGGSAASVAYGGISGENTATAVVAGGVSSNALTLSTNTQGNAWATSGDASNWGSATSSATPSSTQTATPTNTTTQTNTPTQTNSVSQTNTTKALQTAKNAVDQDNSAKAH